MPALAQLHGDAQDNSFLTALLAQQAGFMLSASDEEDADEAAFKLVNGALVFCTRRASASAARNESHALKIITKSHNAKLTWISQ